MPDLWQARTGSGSGLGSRTSQRRRRRRSRPLLPHFSADSGPASWRSNLSLPWCWRLSEPPYSHITLGSSGDRLSQPGNGPMGLCYGLFGGPSIYTYIHILHIMYIYIIICIITYHIYIYILYVYTYIYIHM